MKKPYLAIFALGTCLTAMSAAAQPLPPDIEKTKTVQVAINLPYIPLEMRDIQTNELKGFDIDLGKAMADVLGVKLEYQDGAFEAMPPALQTNRVSMIMSGFYDTPKRRPTFDFVDYLKAGAQFFAMQSDASLKTPADLCGKTVTTIRGTSYPDTIKDFSDQTCVAAGKAPITVMADTDVPMMMISLRTGRAQAGMQGLESVPAIMDNEPGTYRPLGDPLTAVYMGMAFTKENTVLRDAFISALKQVIANGTYDDLIKKWKLDLSAYKDVTVNGAALP